ncbi:trimeric intracellular cation channel type B [Eucyclogobius newberryi]|uniref:trimeric intracellular cation channel type B n=1 Tax=Eucyclogobius newberryi TaxID=166745 RepID=UPI003B5A4607
MELLQTLHVDELGHALANLSMFPYFDMAHYIVSVMSLREQPGAMEVSRVSPLACWFSSMLFCFGGAVLSGVMLAEPPVAPLSNGTGVLLATITWYLVFYCPGDLLYCCTALWPLRLVLSVMKEVTRTWKVLGGVSQAHMKYKDSLLVMIAIGWAKGAGGGLISNFEQLVRGVWRPETNELLKMTYPTKITLIGAVLFALQQTQYLPVQKHILMLIYTVFIVAIKSRMMLTGSSASPFAAIESIVYKTLFIGRSPYAALTADLQDSCTDRDASASPGNGRVAKKHAAASRDVGVNGSLGAKDETEREGTESSKKSN